MTLVRTCIVLDDQPPQPADTGGHYPQVPVVAVAMLTFRRLYTAQVGVSVQLSDRRFDVGETGHYTGLARWLRSETNHSSHASELEEGFAINVGG